MIAPETDPEGHVKAVEFSFIERDLILELYSLDAEIEKRFRLAKVVGKGILVPLSAWDLDELHGAVAAVANHTKDRKVQRKLDGICRRIETILDDDFS